MAGKVIHTIKKISGWLLICLFVLLIAAGIYAYFKVPALLKEDITEYVNKKSNGEYKVRLEALNISIFKWGLTVKNVTLQPVDSTVFQADSIQRQKIYYSFSSPELNIRRIGLFRLLLMKKLVIGKIDIHTPELKVTGASSSAEIAPSKNLELFLKEIEPALQHLHSIRIKEIELIDANYNSYQIPGSTEKISNTGHVTIGVKNFYTDQTLLPNPSRLFDAEDVFIKMTNYKNRLDDSLHILSADEFYYSLKKGHITGTNVMLTPIDSTDNSKNKYRANIPFLKLKSDNIHDFFTSDSIRIDSLYLEKPEIEFFPRKKSEKITFKNISNFDLYELIKNNFKNISINHFVLKNAHLKLFNLENNYFLQQEMKQMNLELENFYLDSVSSDNTDKIFYSDKLLLTVNDYKITLGDNLHQLEIGKLSASTDDQYIRIYQAKVRPISENIIKRNKKIAITVDCDSIKIKQADLKSAYHSRKLPIAGVELYKPVTTITRYDRGQEKIKKSSSLVYEMISDYFKAIYANLVTLENGELVVNDLSNEQQPGHIQSDINFQLTDFALDSISAAKTDKLFFATNIDLVFSNYEMQLLDQLHRMTIDRIDISSLKRKAVIEQLHLFPISREAPEKMLKKFGNSELYEVNIPYLYFLNTDIHQAFFNKKLTISNIRVIEPKISYESFASLKQKGNQEPGVEEFYRLLSNYIKDVDIRQIEAKDGELQLTNHDKKGKTISFDNKFNLLLEKFRFNQDEFGKRKLLFAENIDLKLKKYLFKLSDGVHYLQAEEIGLSTFDSKVYIKNAILYPDITNPKYKQLPVNIHITIPSVSLTGVDMLSLYFDGKLVADNFKINHPDIKLYKVNDNKNKTDFKEFNILMPDKLKSLAISEFQLDDGELQFFKETGNEHTKYMGGNIEMQTHNLKIKNRRESNKSPEISGIFTTNLKDLWFEPIGINQRISLASIDYSTNSKKISIKDLFIEPKRKESLKNQFKLVIPDLQLHSFDIDLAYTKDQYTFERIALANPTFTFYKNGTDSSRFNPYKINLYPYFENFADVFSSGQMTIDNAKFILQTKDKTIEQPGINLSLSGFKVDKGHVDHRFLYSDQFAFSFNNVTRYDRKKMYEFQFDRLGFSSIDNHFLISGVHIKPVYSKEKFSHLINYQSDYFDGDLKEIRFEEMDLERWFNSHELVGKRLQFNNMNLDVYRDKRIPFNEKQRPAMPHDLLRDFDLKFYFDSLELNNANISYSEQIEESPETGRIDFNNVKASLKPFTNIPYLITRAEGVSRLNVNGNLMGGPAIKAQINFDLNSPTNSFDVNGSIDPCELKIMNPIIKPAALMEINTGQLEKFEFQFSGNNEQAKGKLKFAYDNLKISILEVKDGSTKKSKFSSFMANSLMLRSKSPRSKILLPDEINYQRDPSRSILNFWWKSIFDGIKNSFGIKEKDPK